MKELLADEKRPHTIEATVNKNLLIDDTSALQLGQSDQAEFETIHFDGATPSPRSVWPDYIQPDGLYKFSSIRLSFG